MTVRYPFVVTAMIDPVDGETPRDQDFNRIYVELNAIESTLGIDVDGTATNLASRLVQDLNPNPFGAGIETWPRNAVCCEDDPAGGRRGTRRWLYNNGATVVFPPTGSGQEQFPLPYNVFDQTPIAVFQFAGVGVTPFAAVVKSVWMTVSKNLLRIQGFNSAGGASSNATVKLWFVVLGKLEVFDDKGPFMYREERLG